MANDDKLPRGHAYIHMRNRGYRIDVDWATRDSSEAQKMIDGVMKALAEKIAVEKALQGLCPKPSASPE